MYEELKMLLVNLSEQAKREKATPASMLIALYRHVFKDEQLSKKELINLTCLPRSTFYDNDSFVFEPSDIRMSELSEPSDIRMSELSEPSDIRMSELSELSELSDIRMSELSELSELSDIRMSELSELSELSDIRMSELSELSELSDIRMSELSELSDIRTVRKENERKFPPCTPLIKKEKENSFPQTPNGGFPPGPQGGSAQAQEGLHDVLENIKQDYYKANGIVTTADSYTSVGVDATQVDNTPKRDLVNPQEFQKFFDDYPKRKGLKGGGAYEKVRHLWMQLEESGWGYEINIALQRALVSKSWSENDGQYIPTIFNFLENEVFRQFLSVGYKPTKPQPKREQKPLEGGIYDLL